MRILIAEDDLVSRRVLRNALTEWGYEVLLQPRHLPGLLGEGSQAAAGAGHPKKGWNRGLRVTHRMASGGRKPPDCCVEIRGLTPPARQNVSAPEDRGNQALDPQSWPCCSQKLKRTPRLTPWLQKSLRSKRKAGRAGPSSARGPSMPGICERFTARSIWPPGRATSLT